MSRAVAIQQLSVSKAGERVYFELKIPCGCDRIEAIGMTVPSYTDFIDTGALGYQPRSAGQVKLKWQDKGDIFFAAEVDLFEFVFQDEKMVKATALPVGLDLGVFQWGKRIQPLGVCIDQVNTHLRGSYTDILNTQLATPQTYQINIYVYCSEGGAQ